LNFAFSDRFSGLGFWAMVLRILLLGQLGLANVDGRILGNLASGGEDVGGRCRDMRALKIGFSCKFPAWAYIP
jgi:hypothetical protein